MTVILERLTGAFALNCELFFLTLLFSLPLGLVVAFGSMSRCAPLRGVVKTFVWVIRGTPLMLQIIVIYLGPGLLGMTNPWPSGSSGRLVAAVVAFAINYACYFSEIYRGGIEDVPKGQTEAGQVLGMTRSQIFFKVTLLQVVKRILPPMGNEVITLAKDTHFSGYFKKFQYISLTNFGTAFGMGLIVIVFMMGQGYMMEPLIGFFGACTGCVVSTRCMQYFVLKAYPAYREENALDSQKFKEMPEKVIHEEEKSTFLRTLNSLLDGGKSGVEVGMSIIPGVLIISTLVMILTFGASKDGTFTGAAYEGIELLPALANKINFILEPLFGLNDPHQIAFPITALGAVGAALSLIPNFAAQGWIDGNAIAVCTAIGMCWSGYLSTHTAMLDAIGYRELTSKAILSHTIGGLCAALMAHWLVMLYQLVA